VTDDGNPCTDDLCRGGVPTHPATASGTSCGGAQACDGRGHCVNVDCLNRSKDGSETDIDCGGATCPPCATGQSCMSFDDCESHVCAGGICQASECGDQVQNGGETDIDCGGGACPGCMDGAMCMVPSDCVSQLCEASTCVSSCADGRVDGTETDLDCGGVCAACIVGKACNAGSDCTTGQCNAMTCALLNGCDPATAEDHTGQATLSVNFAGAGTAYTPKCFKVSAGTQVTFTGQFNAHPLVGGVVVGAVATPDNTSPFMPMTTTGTTKTFVLSTPGPYGFYCDTHYLADMVGAAFVVP
jgi:plastocyanin